MGNCLRRLTSRFHSVFSKSQDDEETSPLVDRKRPTPVDTQAIKQKQSASVDRRFTVGACQSIEDTGRRSRLRRLTSRFHSVFSKSQDDKETSPLLDRKRLTPVDTQAIKQKQSASVNRRFTVGACQSIEDTGRRSRPSRLTRFHSVFSKSQDDEETSPLLDRKRLASVDTQVISQIQSASVDRRFTVGACQSIEDTGRRSDKYSRITKRKDGNSPILESQRHLLQEVHFYLPSISLYITCIPYISYLSLSQKLIQTPYSM